MSEISATEIKLRRRSRVLEVSFTDGSRFELPFEYLRVHSPSAEVRGHGVGEGVLVVGKQDVGSPRSSRSASTRCGWCLMTATTPDCSPGSICTSSARSANKMVGVPGACRARGWPRMIPLALHAIKKRKAGRFHPAKSSQDPHSIEAFWAFNRSGILG
jgi:hypothetical protein